MTELKIDGYERVASCVDGDYRGLIAIHSTKLGPAVVGLDFGNTKTTKRPSKISCGWRAA